MTFKGKTYETILDMARCIFVEEARLNMYRIQHKSFVAQGYKMAANEVMVLMNLQSQMLEELKQSYETMLDSIDNFKKQSSELEFQVFKMKFIEGRLNEEIEATLNISQTYVVKKINAISDKLNQTEYGKLLLNTLEEK